MIEGRKISLLSITEEHTPLIVNWRNNPNVKKNFLFQDDFTYEMHTKWLQTKVRSGEVVQFIIRENSTGDLIGSVYLRDIDNRNAKAEFGIFIGSDTKRGKGLGQEATKLLCEYGFKELKLHKISLRVLKRNISALHVYTKSGFVQEGDFHDDVILNGHYEDVIFMAKFSDER